MAMSSETKISRDEAAGMRWWNALTPGDRRYWLDRAGSPRPVDAWHTYKTEGKPNG